MDGSSRYRESAEEYYNGGRSSDKVVGFDEFLFPGSYCDRGQYFFFLKEKSRATKFFNVCSWN